MNCSDYDNLTHLMKASKHKEFHYYFTITKELRPCPRYKNESWVQLRTAIGTLSIITVLLPRKSDRSRYFWFGTGGSTETAGTVETLPVLGTREPVGEILPALGAETVDCDTSFEEVDRAVDRAVWFEEVDRAVWFASFAFGRKAPLTLLFLLWVTPTATPTTTPITTNATTTMIARPLGVRYHGVDLDLE